MSRPYQRGSWLPRLEDRTGTVELRAVLPSCSLFGEAVGKAVGVGAGFDDGTVEGETVNDRGAEARIGEGLGPAGEGLVACDGDGSPLAPISRVAWRWTEKFQTTSRIRPFSCSTS